MEGRREKILVALAILMVLKHMIVSIIGIQKVIMHQHDGAIMMMAFILFGSKERMVWKFD